MPPFWQFRRKASETRTDPQVVAHEKAFEQSQTVLSKAEAKQIALEELPSENIPPNKGTIFDLLGPPRFTPAQDEKLPQTSANIDADALISSLHQQYLRALDHPLELMARMEWEFPSKPFSPMARYESNAPTEPEPPQNGQESIHTLLSGAQLLEQAFGPLSESDLENLPQFEPVPEILRLFAPPEYLAAASRRLATQPPPLAQQEHHALGIDSPPSMPKVDTTGKSP